MAMKFVGSSGLRSTEAFSSAELDALRVESADTAATRMRLFFQLNRCGDGVRIQFL